MTNQPTDKNPPPPKNGMIKSFLASYPIGGYLLAAIILGVAIYAGNIQLDIGIATGEDDPTFLGVFIFLSGMLFATSIALATFALSREKDKEG